MVFDKVLYKIIIIFLIILVLLSFVLSQKLNEDFFLKFSADKTLTESTIKKISNIQTILFWDGFVFIGLIILSLYFGRYIKVFIRIHEGFFQNFLLLIVVFVLLILVGEIIFKIMFHDETSVYGFGPGTLRFNSKYVYLNNENVRDKDFELVKPENTTRIIGIGDSFTFGSGIKNVNDTYLKVLERKLNEDGKYEILNFGIPGLDTKSEIEVLNEKALKYNPDIIIIGYFLNDFKDIDKQKSDRRSNELTIPYVGFWLRNFSYLYYFLETRINNLLVNLSYKISYEESLVQTFDSDINKEYNEKLFEEIANISEKENVKVLVVIFPMIYHLDDYPFYSAHEFIREIGEKNNFYVIDLLEQYKKYNEKDLIVNNYDRHPNELAHKIAGETIKKNEIFK